jgi:hypothetical protein
LKSIFQRRRFSKPARPFQETGDDERGRQKGAQRHRVLGSVDLEGEARLGEKVVQAKGGDDR